MVKRIDPFEQRNKFRALCKKIENGCSIDYITNQLSGERGIMPFSKFSCIDIKNDPIYRARINPNGKLFEVIEELSYPIPSLVKVKGRCNEVGQSILYSSTSKLGTIVEHVSNGMNLNTLFTVSNLTKIKTDRTLVFKQFGILDNCGHQWDKYSREFHSFCNQEFSKIINKNNPSENDYNFTIALSNFYCIKKIVSINPTTGGKENANFDMALVYPSVHSKIITNQIVYNIAIQPNIFDLHYKIQEAVTYILIHEKEKDYIMLTPLNRATIENSKLLWEYSYEGMIKRAQNGQGLGEIKSDYVKEFLKEIF